LADGRRLSDERQLAAPRQKGFDVSANIRLNGMLAD
jgi:hypothetical protein